MSTARRENRELVQNRTPTAIALGLYFVLSVTALPAYLVILPLFCAAALVLFSGNDDVGTLAYRDKAAALVLGYFFASYLLSTVFAYSVGASLNALTGLVPALLIFYVVASLGTERVRLVVACLAAWAGAAALQSLGMALAAGGGPAEEIFREYRVPMLVVPNDMLLVAILLPVMGALAHVSRSLACKAALAILMILALVSLWLAASRLAWLTLLLAVLGITVFRWPWYRALGLAAVAFCLALLLDGFLELGALESLLRLRTENARLSVWLAGMAGAVDNPLLGTGPGNFETAYRLGLPRLDLPPWVLVEERMVPWAHNLFLEAFVERGLLGLAALLALLGLLCSRLVALWRGCSGKTGLLYLTLLVSLIAFLFAGLFESTLQRTWVANLLFVYLGLAWKK